MLSYFCCNYCHTSFTVVTIFVVFFFFYDPATTEIYTYLHTLSLPDALPICTVAEAVEPQAGGEHGAEREGEALAGRVAGGDAAQQHDGVQVDVQIGRAHV